MSGNALFWLAVGLLAVSLAGAAALVVVVWWRENLPGQSDPVVTKTGRVLTEAEIQAFVDEAERGYNLEGKRLK